MRAQRKRTLAFGRILVAAALALGLGAVGQAATASPTLTLTGPDNRGPIAPDANGRFVFPNAQLKKNSVNTFTVTAKDDFGREVKKEISITQLSLESVVVAKVKAEPLPPERIFQLVNDGIIDLEDPENFNVSMFQLVLTIGQREVPIDVPVSVPKIENLTGSESIPLPKDPGGGGEPRIEDTEIVVFDKPVPCTSCEVPPRIPGVIVIEGRIKSLKEFFSVRLLLMNTSGLYTLGDVKANVEFPDGGLSATLPKDGTAAFDDILPGDGDVPGQKEREFIVRGDEIGTRAIRVNFGGFVRGPGIPEDAPIPFSGSADTSVEVKGPPSFLVRVYHPDHVVANQPYSLGVEITNTGDGPALYASLDLDIGADATFVDCGQAALAGVNGATCDEIKGPVTRNLRHLFAGDKVREDFVVNPKVTGDVTSCIGQSDQNVSLQVLVGSLGCLTGKRPTTRGVPTGVPTVNVLPYPNALGVGVQSPVTAFFSERMDESTITAGGTFKVFAPDGSLAPGSLRLVELFDSTVAIWQAAGGSLEGNAEYTVQLSQDIKDQSGNGLFNAWLSTFRTTDPNDDHTPPTLELSIEPGVDPLAVIPGQLVQVNAYASDQGTRVARVELRLRDQDVAGAPEEFIDQKTVFGAEEGPTLFAVDSSKLVPGHTYQLRGTAVDRAGNAQDATLPILLRAHAAVPTITLPDDPASAVLQGISLALTPISVSAAVKKVSFFLDGGTQPFATLTLAPFQTSLPTLALALGDHLVRAVAEDGLGQKGEDVLTFTLAENKNEPEVRFAGAVDGAQILQGTRFTVIGTASDPSGIRSQRFALDDPNGAPITAPGGAVTIDTATLAVGTHQLFLLATNNLGVSNDPAKSDASLDFVVKPLPSGPPPAPPVLQPLGAPQNGVVRVQGVAPAGARVDIANVTSGFQTSVYADAGGAFKLDIESSPGDVIRAVVFDPTQSQQPSAAIDRTVPAPRVLASIRMLPSAVTLVAQNATQDLTVTGFYTDGGSENLTAQAALSSSAPAVASVAAGKVVALKRGSATVTATLGGFQDTTVVTVDIVTLDALSVTPGDLTLPAPGATQALTVTGHYSDGSQKVLSGGLSFSSSAPGVISVDPSGIVRAVTVGEATIQVATSGLPPVAVQVRVDPTSDKPPAVALLQPVPGTRVQRGDVVPVSVHATDDVGVSRIELHVTGATTYTETRQVVPAATGTDQAFSFPVAAAAALGGQITVSVQAIDTSGKSSPVGSAVLDVVDTTPPVVSIQAPGPDTAFNYGDSVSVSVTASDTGGLSEIRYEATGAVTASGLEAVTPPQATAGATFHFTVPFGVQDPNVTLRAFARDASGNESSSAPVPITITGADITPPETVATAATPPGSGPTTTITYQVTSGLADLDHVELYFRRNGLGTFNRYTGPLGTGSGSFQPAGATGAILFDATRMGGDGSYEFFTVGVDKTGNREAPPTSGGAIVGDPGVMASFATGAPVVTITSDSEISGTSFEGQNLRVVGATLTLAGPHTFGNVELLSGAVLTQRKTTQTEAYGIELTAWTVTVDATSRLDVTGRGYLGGNKSGLGETAHTAGFAPGAQNGTGGSYGGLGGRYPSGGQPNPVYGNIVNPVDLGSGGGAFSGAGGDGGGRVLLGAINLVVDGRILASGGLSSGSASGEGSGGSLNVTTRTLSGVGAIAADGGTTAGANHVGGGGGRIALRYLDLSTYDASRITAKGGDGYYGDGADGTIYLLPEGQSQGELVINGAGPGSPFTDLILPPGQTFSSITLQNGANVIAQGAIDIPDTLRLRGGSQLTHPVASEAGLQITARRVVVEAGSAIDVSGRGYRGGNQTGLGETAHTLGFTPGSQSGAGGSYGGTGGDFGGNGASLPGNVYGDPKQPNRLGGGGGAWGGDGGAGGGFVKIVASDAVVVDGAVRANGGLSSGFASGEGAGGSVWIVTSRLAGSGAISAGGGTTNGSNHTGGGGGRIALYADFVDPNASFDSLRNVTALGGDGYYGDGAAGTVFVKLAGQTDGTLRLDGGVTSGPTWPVATVLPSIGPGTTSAVTATSLTVDGALPAFVPNGLVGLRLNPDLAQAESFAIVSNTTDTITVATPNEHGVAFTARAGAGKRYAGAWRFDEVTFLRGAQLELADPLIVNGTLAISDRSLLAHTRTTTAYAGVLDVTADRVTVDATSTIDVSGRGYLGGNKTGLGETAQTLGFAPGSQNGTGGSYGGLGGKYAGAGASQPAPPYGSVSEPLELGSGGGAWGGSGGDGGGRIRIVANALLLDGAIRADGGASSGWASGEGSGGSINLRVGSFSGGGVLSASGGTANGGNHTGGGGGRIAIRYPSTLSFPLTSIRAVGGDGYYGDGGHGTVFLKSASQTFGDVIVDGFGFGQPADSLSFAGGQTFDDLTLGSGVRAVADAGLTVTGTLRLTAGAVLSHSAANEFGLRIHAKRVVVEAGSAIDVTGRGYRGGNQTGLGETAHTLGFTPGSQHGAGGSHGGLGGDYSGNGASLPGPVYGDPRRPAELGGGGGAWSGDGGAGGGAVQIDASEAVVVDGAVRADGGLSGGTASGEGAGGSIWIQSPLLSGSGTISADGGTANGGNHTGGGGGRVAIYGGSIDPASNFDATRRITALGGDGYYADGAAGTVYLKLAGQVDGTLLFDGGLTNGQTWGAATTLPPIGPGLAAAVSSNTLTLDGKLRPLVPNGLVGLRLNPDTTQAQTFAIVSNTADTITVATPNESGTSFASIAAVGKRYAGLLRFDAVTFRRGASVELHDPLVVNGTLALAESSLLAHPKSDTAYEAALDLTTGTLTIDATSRIDVTGRGYLGGGKTGLGDTAHTLAFAPGSQSGTGGSYGGLGGKYGGSGASQPNPVYGTAAEPFELGSGGGAWAGPGGDGGGRVRIVADAMVVDGAIRADGALSGGSASGNGSGGAVNLRTGTLAGSGTISANGGGMPNDHTGGGGGRVAIRRSAVSTLPASNVQAQGGSGYYGSGQPGSVFVEGP